MVSTGHFLLHWPNFANENFTLLKNTKCIDCNFRIYGISYISHTSLCKYKHNHNSQVSKTAIDDTLLTITFEKDLT